MLRHYGGIVRTIALWPLQHIKIKQRKMCSSYYAMLLSGYVPSTDKKAGP